MKSFKEYWFEHVIDSDDDPIRFIWDTDPLTLQDKGDNDYWEDKFTHVIEKKAYDKAIEHLKLVSVYCEDVAVKNAVTNFLKDIGELSE